MHPSRKRALLHRAWARAGEDPCASYRRAWRRLRNAKFPDVHHAPAKVGRNNCHPDQVVEIASAAEVMTGFDALPAEIRTWLSSPDRIADLSGEQDIVALPFCKVSANDLRFLVGALSRSERAHAEHAAFGFYGPDHPQAARQINAHLLLHLGCNQAAEDVLERQRELGQNFWEWVDLDRTGDSFAERW